LSDLAAAGSGRGGQLVVVDLLISICLSFQQQICVGLFLCLSGYVQKIFFILGPLLHLLFEVEPDYVWVLCGGEAFVHMMGTRSGKVTHASPITMAT
jgi:hypothetical protein